ncbi:MAG: BACON domain-containing protein [Bacteroidales bacterium]|nr:BACON domain-containing protein [Bacteroidales bacterium]
MKTINIFKIMAAVAVGALLAGCEQQEEDQQARAVAAGETYLEFASKGAGEQTVPIYSDGDWAVDVDSDWISVSPMTGTGMGSITVTVTDNLTGGKEDLPRNGKITVQGGSVLRNAVITVHQDGDTYKGVQEYTLTQIQALDDDAVGKIPEATVVAVTKGGFVLADKAAYLYVKGAREVKAGDVVSLNGAKTTLYSTPAFLVDELEVKNSQDIVYPEAPDMTDQLGSYKGGVVYASLRGSMVNGVLKVGKANVQVLEPIDEVGLDEVDLHKVTLTGYAVGVSGATGYFVAVSVSDEGADEALVPYPLRWAIGKDLNYSNDTFNNDNPRIDPVQGIGYIEYVPYDLENTNAQGNYKLDVQASNPRVTGPWVNDYWLFYGNGAIKAGTEVQIAFEMRSSKWGQKFWLLEYLDGDQWLPAGTPQTSTEPGEEVFYTCATNIDGATNQPVMETIRFRRNNDHLQIRLRCVVNWRGGGDPMSPCRSTASSRLSITNVDDDTYRPSVLILKEGDGVEKDPVYANIEVSTDLLTFNGTPDAPKTIKVKSDYDFTISTSYDWLTFDVAEGPAGEETAIAVTCAPSELSELREGTIRIVSEDSEKVINVVQSAAGQMLDPFISVSTGNRFDIPATAGSKVLTIQSNVEFQAESLADWITLTALSTKGMVDWTDYEVAYTANDLETERTGTVRFFNAEMNLESVVTFVQAGKSPDPVLPEGVYFQDDFEWLAPWTESAPDDITANTVGSSKNIFTTADLAGALAEFQTRGYGYIWGWKGQEWSDGIPDSGNKQTLYVLKNYLKFGKTDYNSGIILPALSAIEGTADVDLTFDWCWCMTGGKKPDTMTLTVTVSGGGTIASSGTETSPNIESSQPTEGDQTVLEWQHASVRILGATPSTRITIRPTNYDPTVSNSARRQNRWYLDNVKVAKVEKKVYFREDFEWLAPWTASAPDDVTANSVGSSKNIFTTADLADALAELQTRGYGYIWGWKDQPWSDGTPDNGNKQTMYVMKNYLKFGKTDYNSGIILPALSAIEGTADVDLTFDWSWCMTGGKKPDTMTLTVTVSGGGTIASSGTETSPEIESSQPTEGDQTVLAWQHASVRILGATSSTRITIRPTNYDPTVSNSARRQNRWYLDNIKVSE